MDAREGRPRFSFLQPPLSLSPRAIQQMDHSSTRLSKDVPSRFGHPKRPVPPSPPRDPPMLPHRNPNMYVWSKSKPSLRRE